MTRQRDTLPMFPLHGGCSELISLGQHFLQVPLAVILAFRLLLTRPGALPTNLEDWESLDDEDTSEKAWHHFGYFLALHGVRIYGTHEYQAASAVGFSGNPAEDPFQPNQNEDFIHREVHYYAPWRYPVPVLSPGVDQFGRQVMVKAVRIESLEWEIFQELSLPAAKSDRHNHTIPVLSVIPAGAWIFVVLPRWGAFWGGIRGVQTVDEHLELAYQLIEGLCFMHKCGVAHGDIHQSNIVWNVSDARLASGPQKRMFPCSYAYIDFGSSQRINRLTARYNPSVVQVPPSRYEIPEKQTGNYEPLAADVYMLGKLLLEQVRDSETLRINAPEYLRLLASMSHQNPTERPTASDAYASISEIRRMYNDSG